MNACYCRRVIQIYLLVFISKLGDVHGKPPPKLKFACQSHPCQNYGTCNDLEEGSYECVCRKGYRGKNCQVDTLSCEKGWSLDRVSAKCLFVDNVATRWTKAVFRCMLRGAQLAKIESEEDNRAVYGLTLKLAYSTPQQQGAAWIGAWIGLSDRQTECGVQASGSCWQWVDNVRRNYTNWMMGHPMNYTAKEDCVAMTATGSWATIADDVLGRPEFHGCNTHLPYICEKSALSPCQPNPCKNGGSCITAHHTFKCECTEIWGGPVCDKCLCKNGGTCEPNDNHKCTCRNLHKIEPLSEREYRLEKYRARRAKRDPKRVPRTTSVDHSLYGNICQFSAKCRESIGRSCNYARDARRRYWDLCLRPGHCNTDTLTGDALCQVMASKMTYCQDSHHPAQ